MKNIINIWRGLLIICMVFISCVRVTADEYNLIIIPSEFITSEKCVIKNTNMEELLIGKIKNKLNNCKVMERKTLLKFIQEDEQLKTNKKDEKLYIKIIFNKTETEKLLLIKIETELNKENSRNEISENYDSPLISGSKNSIRLMTTAKLYDKKTEKIVWSDVYNKNLDITSSTLINNYSEINNYYDELALKIINIIQKELKSKSIKEKINMDKLKEKCSKIKTNKEPKIVKEQVIKPEVKKENEDINILAPNEDNTTEAIKSLQTRIRNKSKRTELKFDTSVNDI